MDIPFEADVNRIIAKTRAMKTTYAQTKSQNVLSRRLCILGYNEIGRGAYSVVFAHDDMKDKVLKVTLSRVDGYHAFVDWLQDSKDLLDKKFAKHLPVIHNTIKHGDIRITVLEHLKPISYIMADPPSDEESTFGKLEKMLRNFAYRLDLANDIGGRNVMRRGRTFVITDPWSHAES